MANVSIPNLPSQTATTDLDLLVITDSGETTTSKITKADFLDGVGGNLVSGSGTDAYSLPGLESNASGTRALVLGTAGSSSGTDNTIIGGSTNSITSSADDNIIAGGFVNSISGGSRKSAVIGGQSNSLQDGDYFLIAGGLGNSTFSGADYGCIVGSRTAVVGGDYNKIFGSDGGRISNSAGQQNTIFGGKGTMIGTTEDLNTIIGGQDSFIGDQSTPTSASGNTIINSFNSKVDANDNVSLIGVRNYTATTDNVVVVPQLVMTEYASLNFADDLAAAAGGVVLGGLYHNSGDLRVRIT